MTRDHPRIRGKDATDKIWGAMSSGSPPHTRERLLFDPFEYRGLGITPAYAGKTKWACRHIHNHKDHPRIRGKDSSSTSMPFCISGSPPHTRERRLCLGSSINNRRITPAYAGKTPFLNSSRCLRRDHPRIRGKDYKFRFIF